MPEPELPEIPPPQRGFPAEEYARRCEQMQQQMAHAGIDLLLFTTAAEFYYFCGFHTAFWQSPTRPWFLLLPASGKPVAVIPTIGSALMQNCYVDDIRAWVSPHPADEGVSLLAQAIRDNAGGASGRAGGAAFNLGIMRGRQSILRMPPADFAAVCEQLPHMRIKDSSAMVQQARMIKSAAEINKIAYIAERVSEVFAGWQEWLQPQMPLGEICRQFKIRCLQAGADDIPYLAAGMGSSGYSDVISPPDERRFSPGDILMLDAGGVYDGYYCDFDRNIACGKISDISDEAQRCYETLWHATNAGIAAATVGNTCRDIFHAMHEVIAAAGFADTAAADNAADTAAVGRYGHGLGIELTETPSIAAWDETPLAAGMVLTLEPSAAVCGDKLLVHEENIAITDSTPRLLTRRTPPQLPVIGC